MLHRKNAPLGVVRSLAASYILQMKSFHGHDDEEAPTDRGIAKGLSVLEAEIRRLPDTPGVYKMLSAAGEALYIGKAKALKKRVGSYAQFAKLPIRLQRMVAQIASMEFVHTHTEAEALLLESNLIKKDKPRYNILLRDDKSFPYIMIPEGHDFPTMVKYRGARKEKGQYFGPFAGAGDVNRTLEILQRIFLVRNCTDSYFAQRSRPCLQYHIKRCSAPCVGMVSKARYNAQIDEARDFLEGKSRAVQIRMSADMQAASESQRYEEAAALRDRIKALTAIQAQQDINVEGLKNADVMAIVQKGERSCVQVMFFRAGRNYGSRAFFPRHSADEKPEAILEAFVGQFYVSRPAPRELILSHTPPEHALLQKALGQLSAGDRAKVTIATPRQGARRRVVEFALKNAASALDRHMLERAGDLENLERLAALLNLEETPRRIEVYDNSHISGKNMVGAMIVAGAEGFRKASYRQFNIRDSADADDYAMMREVFKRRFTGSLRQQKDEAHTSAFPDVVIVDGGKGQLGAVTDILQECGVYDQLTVVAIAKGEDRNAGRETLFVNGLKPIRLELGDTLLYYLQRLRDEAHRFAVGTHRKRRTAEMHRSPLDDIDGIGPRRKKALLNHFGSAKAVASAGVADLQKIEGISRAFAEKIYDHFHG